MRESFEAVKPEENLTDSSPNLTLAARPKRELAAPSNGRVIGEIRTSDLRWPKLTLVGKQSELVNEGKLPGSYVFNQVETVSDGKSPLRMVILTIAKEYWEKVPQGQDRKAQMYTRLSDVHEAGGTIDRQDKDSVPFQECGRVMVLVESDKENPGFIFKAGDKYYAPATWFLGASAYMAVGRTFITDDTITLRNSGGLPSRFYEFTSKITSNALGSWFVPVCRLTTAAVPPELIEQVKALFNTNN